MSRFVLTQVHHECDAFGCDGDEFRMGEYGSMDGAKAAAVEDAGKPIEWDDKGSRSVGSRGWQDAEPPYWEYIVEATEAEESS